MFERYTDKARRVIFFARYEASQFGADAIEAEHVMLGLLREDKGLIHRFFDPPEGVVEEIRKQLQKRLGVKPTISTSVDMPLSPIAKRVLGYAQEESERLQHRYIGTEHLLLGLLREEKSLAAEILYERGLRLNQIREELGRSAPDALAGGPPRAGSRATADGTSSWAFEAAPVTDLILDALVATTFGRCSNGAKLTLFLARCEAGGFGAALVAPEHLLLGLLQLNEEPAIHWLVELKTAYADIYEAIASRVGGGRAVLLNTVVPFSAASLRVLAYAEEEIERVGHERLDAEHLLVGLLREEGSLAAELLAARGVTIEEVRRSIAGDEETS